MADMICPKAKECDRPQKKNCGHKVPHKFLLGCDTLDIGECPDCIRISLPSPELQSLEVAIGRILFLNGWRGDLKLVVSEIIQAITAHEQAETAAMREALHEAKLQIECLHDMFKATGSGNAVLAKIDTALKGGK